MKNSSFMLRKKGQVTVFIVIGILIVALIVGAYFIFRPTVREEQVSSDLAPIKAFVDECLESVAKPGVFLQAVQGGYIYLPEQFVETQFGLTTYGYIQGENTLLSLASQQEQLNQYINSEIETCINDFKDFNQQIETEAPSVVSTFDETEVDITLTYPITLTTANNEQQKMQTFVTKVDVRYGHIFTIAQQIIGRFQEDPNYLDLDFLNNFDSDVKVINHDEQTLLFEISEGDFIYLFAAQFAPNDPPIMNLESEYVLKDAEPFYLEIPYSSDDPVTFSDDSPLFEISHDATSTGKAIIEFTPHVTGSYPIRIKLTDQVGQFDEHEVLFRIIE